MGETPSFKEVMDLLGLSAGAAAAIFGVTTQSVRQARLDPSAGGYRPPPKGWEKTLAKLARERGGELAKLAEKLET